MKFRARLFTLLAMASLAWILIGMNATGHTLNNQLAITQNSAQAVGTYTGAGLVTLFVLCTGIPAFALFALLAWRNNAGYHTERRHKETLLYRQNDRIRY